MCYRQPGAGVRSIGIVLYVPGTDDFYTRILADCPFLQGDDREILNGISAVVLAVAKDLGARATFSRLSENLSNAIFVEGPYPVLTNDPEQTVSELFATKVDESPEYR